MAPKKTLCLTLSNEVLKKVLVITASSVNLKVVSEENLILSILVYKVVASTFQWLNSRVLWYSNCAEFLSSQVLFSSLFRSLGSGLHLSDDTYEQLIAGTWNKWYHQKQEIHQHLSSETHNNAVCHMNLLNEGRSRQMIVAKNQLHAAIAYCQYKVSCNTVQFWSLTENVSRND